MIIPYGPRICCQIIAVTTGASASGTNMATRRKSCPLTRVWIRSAAPSPNTFMNKVEIATKMTVCSRALWKTASLPSCRKFARPFQVIWSR